MLAVEFPLELGDRPDGRVGTQTSQAFRVSRACDLRRGLRLLPRCSRLGTGRRPADGVGRRSATFEQALDLRAQPIAGEFAPKLRAVSC
jgi:hypothetical protein